MRSIVSGVAAAAALLAAGGAAQAQDTTARGVGVLDLLRIHTLSRTANGAEHMMSAEVGSLSDSQTRETHLVGGWAGTLTVLGVCDQYCGDLDLFIIDDLGQEVISDTSIDDTPEVTFRALAGRSYTLRVRMYDCAQDEVCMYGVASYWR